MVSEGLDICYISDMWTIEEIHSVKDNLFYRIIE